MRLALALFTIIFCFPEAVIAQKIRFTDPTNKWVYIWKQELASQGHIMVYKSVRDHFSGDTIINGINYSKHHSYVPQTGVSITSLLREDTVSNIVYKLANVQGQLREDIYLNFNLKMNDTLFVAGRQCIVSQIDSVRINNYYNKVFTVTDLQGMGGHYITEGITNYRYYLPPGFSQMVWLNCFWNNGIRPSVSNMPDDNQNDCSDTALNITTTREASAQIEIYPQPANSMVTIKLPSIIRDGEIRLINAFGAMIYRKGVKNTALISLQKPMVVGLYQYILQDNANQNISTGKILFE